MTHEIRGLQDRLGCFGYFGFGNGYTMRPGVAGYCNTCPIARECWTAHKARAATILPAAVEEFEKLVDQGFHGKALLDAWWALTTEADGDAKRVPDPYMAVMLGNHEAAFYLKADGRWTVEHFRPPYPLPPIARPTS